MRKVISINVTDQKSVDDALNDLENYAKTLNDKLKEVLRRLAWIGAETANASYADGYEEGNGGVQVNINELPSGYQIVASGDDVYFLEFGTGVMAGAGYDTSVIAPPVDISSGSWSRSEHGTGEFANYGSWHHDGAKYTLTIPRKGMYFAAKEIERRVSEVVDEVFSS